MVFDLVLTVTRLVPINREVATWASEPPAQWDTVRDRWNRLLGLRALAMVLAAILAVCALAIR